MSAPHTIIVSLAGALTRLESFPGEIFGDEFEVLGISLEDFKHHDKQWHHHRKIAVLAFTYYQYPDIDLSMFDMILLIDEEAIDQSSDQYLSNLGIKFQNDNIIAITSGYHLGHPLNSDDIYCFPFFFANICRDNRLQQHRPNPNADWKFDALLGMTKPHRQYVFYQMAQHGLLPCSLVNFTTNQHNGGTLRTIYRSPELDKLEPQGVLESLPDAHLNSYLHVGNNGPRISHVIPWQVYKNSSYSIVAETNWENYIFFSEKTAKCLFAQRPFVFFGSHGMLDRLRRWGFITFDTVIDESYDEIQDNDRRFAMAFDQVLRLTQQVPTQVYRAVQRALEHNQRHIQNRNYFVDPMRTWLMQQIRQRCG